METEDCQLAKSKITYFCGKTPSFFGIKVYRKSTGDQVVGKSAAKNLQALLVVATELNASFEPQCRTP